MWFTKKAMRHSSRGDFKYENRRPVKMENGGHGQANVNYLTRHKIRFNVGVEFKNGVRLGTVSIHKKEKYRTQNKQAWFPENWTEKDIYAAAERVISLKKNKNKTAQQPKVGCFKGVRVGVYAKNGKVNTVYPWYNQHK